MRVCWLGLAIQDLFEVPRRVIPKFLFEESRGHDVSSCSLEIQLSHGAQVPATRLMRTSVEAGIPQEKISE